MKKRRVKAGVVFALLACTAMIVSGCGSKTSEASGEEVSGRVSAFSDSEITVEVFQKKKDDSSEGRPDAASGGAISEERKPDGEAPQGENPPERPSESMKPDGEMPASGGAVGSGERPSGGMPKGESKTYTITEDTKFYEKDEESTTEISLNDLELGGDVTLELDSDGKNVISVTKQQRKQGNMSPGGQNDRNTTKEKQQSK